tara:strand:- start:11796 stop:12893 length:1098 start_codon:yes stop_codon:yes gene_type:complete
MNFLKDKTVLVTGHTGFKGSWLSSWLISIGARVVGISIDVPSEPSNYKASNLERHIEDHRIDICDFDKISKVVSKCQPDYVFHLAAQALVLASYEFPFETIKTNALGSVSILEAVRKLNKQVNVIMITSDKVYDNVEWTWGYRENDKLGGKDPYSASKGMAELGINTYIHSFFNKPESNIRIAIGRAGNVIGGGDWALDRIVPDCMKAWSSGIDVSIRNPHATRPWQHVLEPLSGYISLARFLEKNNDINGEAYNFGPNANQSHSVSELIGEMGRHWENIRWNNNSHEEKSFHEASLLKLNCDKALHHIDWKPSLHFDETVKMTVEWYKTYYQNKNQSMFQYTIKQIEEYHKIAKMRKIDWALHD